MKDFDSQENRVRKPSKGLRQRLRIALRDAGVKGKFRTDHGRHFEGRLGQFLVVMSTIDIKLPFTRFEEKPVVFMKLP